MISFIVPAHNERACLGRTLQAIHNAGRTIGKPYEIIVVDDTSTDGTAETARQRDATVVSVNHRQIAATRNSGARAALGNRLFFVDADTTVNARAVASALRHMDKGAAGGGAPTRFDSSAPVWAQLLLLGLGFCMRLGGITGGAFMFCTREAFHATGGFDERLFGAEDAAMSWALKREGRFVVLWQYVLTSGRRLRGLGGLRMLATLFRMAFFPGLLTRRSRVEKIWYESRREEFTNSADSIAVRILNVIMLLIVVALLPVWGWIPWSVTPQGSPLGEIRWGIAMFSCHVGLVVWPCAWFLLRSLFRQTRWLERLRVLALIALCVSLGWGSTREVIGFWIWVGQSVMHV